MPRNYSLLVWDESDSSLTEGLSHHFDVTLIDNMDGVLEQASNGVYKVIICGPSITFDDKIELLSRIKGDNSAPISSVPVVILDDQSSLDRKLAFFNGACDDYIPSETEVSEIVARINKTIFHKIANEQLHSQLKVANEMAFMAMSDTSDLGTNIQFLLESANCSNLDELGQLLFQSLKVYGLNGSLQMRGRYEVKNMEPTGLAKDLEAQLLTELKDRGRYYDFGTRTVMNYDQVSVLIRNMPLDDEKKYGAIKDNVFSLLQGTDARIKALDNVQTMRTERELLELLTRRMQDIFPNLEVSYHSLVRNIADVVEDMAEKIENSIMNLGLTENQEKVLEIIMADGIARTHEVFGEGLKLDSDLERLVNQVNMVFEYKDKPDFYRYLDKIRDLLKDD